MLVMAALRLAVCSQTVVTVFDWVLSLTYGQSAHNRYPSVADSRHQTKGAGGDSTAAGTPGLLSECDQVGGLYLFRALMLSCGRLLMINADNRQRVLK